MGGGVCMVKFNQPERVCAAKYVRPPRIDSTGKCIRQEIELFLK